MATELKTDSRHRYMLYRRDEFCRSIFLTNEEQTAIDEGKRFAARAHADVWAQDPDLVQRVREFLGANFHWHERLAKLGSGLEVVQTLMDMVRGTSIVLIARDAPVSHGSRRHMVPPVKKTFHRQVMEMMALSEEGATACIIEYNDRVERLNAKLAALRARAALNSAAQAAGTSTPLGGAQPFEYRENVLENDAEEIAARGVSAAEEAQCDALYETRMTYCRALSRMYGGDMRTLLACRQQAFQDYQACRGY